MGRGEREILVWHHRLKNCSLKYLLRLSKRGVTPRKLNNTRILPPCVACLFGNFHKRIWRTKGKRSYRLFSKPSETRPGAMTSIDHMVSAQPGIILQFTGDLTHSRLWSSTVFVGHYSYYCYTHLIRVTSSEETLRAKEAYDLLLLTHRDRICTYRDNSESFYEPQFKE